MGILLALAPFAAADVLLARGGHAEWTVVRTVADPPAEQFAAGELLKYLNGMTGADFGRAIAANEVSREIVVAVYDDLSVEDRAAIGLADDPDAWCVALRGENTIEVVGRSPRAVFYAVYNFLDALGCRFLAPGFDYYQGRAEVVPHVPTLSVPTAAFRAAAPRLKLRKLYVEEGISHTPGNLNQLIEWMPKAGYDTLVVPTNYQGAGRVKWDNFRATATPELQKRGITIEVGGHGYQNFLNARMEGGRLFDAHPEFFYQDAAGQRVADTEHHVFCTSNGQAVAYLIGNFVAYLKAHPEIEVYDFWPPDGGRWCECAACRALGSPSDRQALLLAQVGAAARKVRPGLRLEMIAYSNYVTPPVKETIDPSVLVDFCPIDQEFDRQIDDAAAGKNAEYVRDLRAWRKAFGGDISIYSYFRKYAWDSLPVVMPGYLQGDLKFYAGLPVQGVSTYSEPGDWGTYELNHYCLAALAWDPAADVNALVKKFCAARYGDSAGVAAGALLSVGEATRTCGSIPNNHARTSGEIEAALGRVREAEERVNAERERAADGAVKAALARLALGCRYSAMDLELEQMRAAGAGREEIGAKVDALYAFLIDHKDDGVFLTKRIALGHLRHKYGMRASTRPAR